MLTTESPTYEIEGIIVYRDHAVPTQFYYTAPVPKITRTGGRLMFDLLVYAVDLKHSPLSGTAIPDELGAGFLTLGVDCSLTDGQRRVLLRGLNERTGIPEAEISLHPVPYHKGTVRVLALDKFTTPGEELAPAASSTPLKGRPTFVEQVLGSGKPSLLGDLRAIFSVSLNQDGITFLEGLYRDRATPVGVVYELNFYGLRPTVDAIVTADVSTIHKHFGGGLSGQYAWFKGEVNAGLDFLEQQGVVKIKLTSQMTGEEAQKSKELALSLFKDKIVQELFRPTAPVPAMPASATPGGDAAASAPSGKDGAMVKLTLRFNQREERREVTYEFSERAPEERTHSPQGFLPVLLSPAELERRIHRVSLHSEFFELLDVLVAGPTKEEFDAIGIRQVEATVTYGEPGDRVPPETKTLLFRPDATGDKPFAVRRNGRKSLAYNMALTYEFVRRRGMDADSFRYELPTRVYNGRTPRINPFEDFGVLDVEAEPGRLHADVREVDVRLSYQTPDGRFTADERLRLVPGAGAAPHRWQVRTRATEVAPYSAQATFIFQDGATYEAPPKQFTDGLLRVDSPFPSSRKLLIRPNVTSAQISQITVELEYEDVPNDYRRRFMVELAQPFKSQEVVWPILDANRQVVRYRATVHEPGFISESDWEDTADPSIVVGTVGSRTAVVQIRLIGSRLADAGLDAVLVKIALALDGAPTGEEHSLILEGPQTSAEVKLALPPGAALRYRYQTTAFKSDGQVVESEWKVATSSLLPLSTRAF